MHLLIQAGLAIKLPAFHSATQSFMMRIKAFLNYSPLSLTTTLCRAKTFTCPYFISSPSFCQKNSPGLPRLFVMRKELSTILDVLLQDAKVLRAAYLFLCFLRILHISREFCAHHIFFQMLPGSNHIPCRC